MLFLAVLVAVGVTGLVLVPRLGLVLAGVNSPERGAALPWLAAAMFVAAWTLPDPTVSGSNTFTQHAVGGGGACAAVGIFVALNLGVRSSIVRVVIAYTLAAALGTAVELAEFAADHIWHMDLTADTALDLVANTIGAVVAAVVVEVGLRLGGASSPPTRA